MASRKVSLAVAEAPCRLDCGGTVDIAPLAAGLSRLKPATLNIALRLRTKVRAERTDGGGVRVESIGFGAGGGEGVLDYTHPLGFFFLAADYFGLSNVSLTIESASPPQSALGGSSSALTAAVAALARLAGRRLARWEVARAAFTIEQALFPVPCGRQDHLAAAYGGVNLWTWKPGYGRSYSRRRLTDARATVALEKRLLVAYPGQTHSSADVNGTWVRGFISDQSRPVWVEIVKATRELAEAIEQGRWDKAAAALRRETELRRGLTPEVLTEAGARLVGAAEDLGLGARFTGAGGGGCLYALGPKSGVDALRPIWRGIIDQLPGAAFLPGRIDRQGLRVTVDR